MSNNKVTLSSRRTGPNNEATRSIIVRDRVNEWDGTVKAMGRAHENHGLGHGLGPRKSWAGLTKTMGGAHENYGLGLRKPWAGPTKTMGWAHENNVPGSRKSQAGPTKTANGADDAPRSPGKA